MTALERANFVASLLGARSGTDASKFDPPLFTSRAGNPGVLWMTWNEVLMGGTDVGANSATLHRGHRDPDCGDERQLSERARPTALYLTWVAAQAQVDN